jgi:hypothetical protein
MFLKLQYLSCSKLPLPGQILSLYYQGAHLLIYPYQLGDKQQVLCFVPSFLQTEYIEDIHPVGEPFPEPGEGATLIEQGCFFEGLYFVHYWGQRLKGPVVFEMPKELGSSVRIVPSLLLPGEGWFLPYEIATLEGIENQLIPIRLIAPWIAGAIESLDELQQRWQYQECLWLSPCA